MNYDNVDISKFTYESKYSDPGRTYTGSVAVHFVSSDIITYILHNRLNELGYESRYFSYVVNLFFGYEYWIFSIDMDLLNMDDIEIVAFRHRASGNDNIRIHLKGDRWFDNIDELKGAEARLNAVVVAKVVKSLGPYIKSLYSNRNKQYCVVMAERYASDFKD